MSNSAGPKDKDNGSEDKKDPTSNDNSKPKGKDKGAQGNRPANSGNGADNGDNTGPKKGDLTEECNFCSGAKSDDNKLIASPPHPKTGNVVHICGECVELSADIFKEAAEQKPDIGVDLSELTPRKMVEHLDEFVIGQEEAKKTMAIAVFEHYIRLEQAKSNSDIKLDKENVLLVGPTGTGKTYITETLAKVMGVPFVSVDATEFTEAGYKGEDVESIALKLLQKADFDVEKAQVGIVHIDEIDKVRKKGDGNTDRDINGEGVQQALLKLVEGNKLSVDAGKKEEKIAFDTSNVLFIGSGAFPGLEKIIEKRMGTNEKGSIGFGAPIVDPNDKKEERLGEILANVTPDDLIAYGFIPEFVGRLPNLSTLHDLDHETLVRILTEPKNCRVKQELHKFEKHGVELVFTDDALQEIAIQAHSRKTGARGLGAVVAKVLKELRFDLPNLVEEGVTKAVVNAACVRGEEEPLRTQKDAVAPDETAEAKSNLKLIP